MVSCCRKVFWRRVGHTIEILIRVTVKHLMWANAYDLAGQLAIWSPSKQKVATMGRWQWWSPFTGNYSVQKVSYADYRHGIYVWPRNRRGWYCYFTSVIHHREIWFYVTMLRYAEPDTEITKIFLEWYSKIWQAYYPLTHWGQLTLYRRLFQRYCLERQICIFWVKYHWSLFLSVLLTKS